MTSKAKQAKAKARWWLAASGANAATMRKAGRWKSDAWIGYVRPTTAELSAHQLVLHAIARAATTTGTNERTNTSRVK